MYVHSLNFCVLPELSSIVYAFSISVDLLTGLRSVGFVTGAMSGHLGFMHASLVDWSMGMLRLVGVVRLVRMLLVLAAVGGC